MRTDGFQRQAFGGSIRFTAHWGESIRFAARWGGAPISCVLLLLVLPPLSHTLDLAGWFSEDPSFFVSGLTATPPTSAGVLPGYPGWIDGNAGVTTEALGRLSVEDWLHGQVPWWNPYSGVGMPLGAEVQASTFFLPFVFLLKFSHGVTLLKIAMQVLAGFGMLRLLREMRVGLAASVTGAVLAEFNGSFAWHADGPIMPIAFLPWLLWGLERSARDGRGGVAAIALSIAFSIAAGFPEVAYLDGLLALVWACVLASESPAASAFVGRVALGGAIGLLISAPVTLSFLLSLPISFVGGHATAMATRHMFAGDAPMLLFPYVNGALVAHLGPVVGKDPWWQIGGYLGTVTLFLVILSLLLRRSRLRWALACWIAVASARAFGAPVATQLVNLVPGVSYTLFDVYVAPSCEIAAIVLAALALDDRAVGRRAVLAAWVLSAAAAGISVAVGWGMIRGVLRTGGHALVLASLLWGVLSLVVVAAVMSRRGDGMRRLAAALTVLNAVVLFSVPLLSGARTPKLDLAPVETLRRTLGLGRFASVGGIVPNYGAMYGLAEINANALPQPAVWVEHVKSDLMPRSDGLSFFPTVADGWEFVTHQAAYEAAGVRAVVAPAGSEPFRAAVATAEIGTRRPLAIGPSSSLDVPLPSSLVRDGSVDAVGVVIGTYVGVSDGALAAKLCTPKACVSGQAELSGAIDNARLVIRFASALPVAAGDTLSLRLSHVGGTHGVAIWTWAMPGAMPGATPGLTLFYRWPGERPVFVGRSGGMDVYRLSGAASYFSVSGGSCRLTPRSRTDVVAECESTATLARLELAYPGWHARVNGATRKLATSGGIFQALRLPAGRSRVRFSYRPPFIWIGYVASLLGLAGLLGAGVRTRVEGAERTLGVINKGSRGW